MAPSAPQAVTTRLTREQVLALADRPYQFLGVALQVLARLPDEAAIRDRAVESLRTLGLPTLARAIAGERSALHAAGPEAIPLEHRLELARSNLGAIRSLHTPREDLDEGHRSWAARAHEWAWFRANDANIIRVHVPSGRWTGLADERSAAAAFERDHLRTPIEGSLTLEGIDPPWVLLAASRATARRADGYAPNLRIVEAEPDRFFDSLASEDLRDVLSREGVDVFVGPACERAMLDCLRARFETRITGAYVPQARLGAAPRLAAILRQAEQEQLARYRELRARVEAVYAPRDPAWWAERFSSIARGDRSRHPLRVLIPTCRYSTFVRHSSADLGRSFERAGWQAEVFEEPDASSRFSSLAYLRRLDEFRPDLVVLINYTRSGLGDIFPANLPFVCVIQDAMPHLFDSRVGRAQTALDFLAGHVFPELWRDHGYPRARSLPFVVAADDSKFHPGPVAASLRREHECEVAYVSHHSETPDELHARLWREAGDKAAGAEGGVAAQRVRRVLDRLREPSMRVGERTMGRTASTTLHEIARAAVRDEFRREPDETMATLLVRQYAAPMAERCARHRALAWAGEIARRRGWRLRLYGRGWERHPDLGEFARPQLDHGEALRASYASAGVHLHMSVHSLVHQRVIECVLSGGFPLCRLTEEEVFNRARYFRTRALRSDAQPTRRDADRLGIAVADHPDLVRMAMLRGRFGLACEDVVWYREARRDLARREDEIPLERQGLWLLGDDPAHFFRDADELEARVEFALTHAEARRALGHAAGARARERLTTDAFAAALARFVAASIAPAAAPREAVA